MKYQLIRNRIIDGVYRFGGYTIDEVDIPDHEWHELHVSGAMHPPLPPRRPKSEVVDLTPHKTESTADAVDLTVSDEITEDTFPSADDE